MMKQDIAFKDIEPGDLVTLSYEGHEFTGEVWRDNYGMLWVGATALGADGAMAIEVFDGNMQPLVFVSATREVKLPTGIGAVIRDGIGDIYIRIGEDSWRRTRTPAGAHGDSDVTFNMPFEVLSEGVEID